MSSNTSSKDGRSEIKQTLERMRKDISHASKDLASASKALVSSTSKFVQDVSPKVSAALDESLEKASVTFKRTMKTIDTETKPQQVKLLQAYRTFLSKQVDAIEKRLKKLKQ